MMMFVCGCVDVVFFCGFCGFCVWCGVFMFRGVRYGLKFLRCARDNDVESDYEIFIIIWCGLGYVVM